MANEDAEVVRRVLAGQTNEYRLLVEKYQWPVFRFVHSLVGNQHEAEDLTQDTFLAAFANLASYTSSRARFSTWMFTIARNRCVNYLKRLKSMPGESVEVIDERTAAEQISEREFLDQLDAALASLPLEQRTAFVLAEIEELPYAEIARIESVSLGTVKSRIHRAKQRLRACLAPTLGEQ